LLELIEVHSSPDLTLALSGRAKPQLVLFVLEALNRRLRVCKTGKTGKAMHSQLIIIFSESLLQVKPTNEVVLLISAERTIQMLGLSKFPS
jgi:hypothetical protein